MGVRVEHVPKQGSKGWYTHPLQTNIAVSEWLRGWSQDPLQETARGFKPHRGHFTDRLTPMACRQLWRRAGPLPATRMQGQDIPLGLNPIFDPVI